MNLRSRVIYIGILSVVLASIGLVLLAYELNLLRFPFGGPKYTNSNNPYKQLMERNSAFSSAENQRRLGNATSAIALYQDALRVAEDKEQRDQILYKIARAESERGNDAVSVDMLRAIVLDDGAIPLARAYASQTLMLLWLEKGNAVAGLVFAQSPYKELWRADSRDLTRRNVSEFTTAFYPLALSELYVADWYAAELERSATGNRALSEVDQALYTRLAMQHVLAADNNLQKIEDDPNLAAAIPATLTLRAVVERALAVSGLTTYESAEEKFKRALAAYATVDGDPEDGLARFQYARFLNQVYGDAGVSEIRGALAPLYEDKRYMSSDAMAYFARERENVTGKKRYIVSLADKDPSFKKLLISIGWTEGDFARKS